MLGWIICREGTCEKLKTRTVCGVPFLVLETPAPRRWRERRVLTAALRKMAQWGVRRAVVQGGELPELAAFGILPLDPFPLRLALLPKLLTWVDREWSLGLKSASVLLSADSSGGETLRAALELTRRARYVLHWRRNCIRGWDWEAAEDLRFWKWVWDSVCGEGSPRCIWGGDAGHSSV